MPELNLFQKQRKSLIYFEIPAKREMCETGVLPRYCQGSSRVPASSHIKRGVQKPELFREGSKELKHTIRKYRVRFRVCVFLLGGSIDSFPEVRPHHRGLQLPNRTP
jgi:hypothetical protein